MTEAFNPLNRSALKVSHHGSEHGTVLECIEVFGPESASDSCGGLSVFGIPHEIALLSLKEETDRVYFTDYSNVGKARSGTMVVVSPGTGSPGIVSIGAERSAMASPP